MYSAKSNKWLVIRHDKSDASAFNPLQTFCLGCRGVRVTMMNLAKPGQYLPNKLRVGVEGEWEWS